MDYNNVGIDLVEVSRIEKIYNKFGLRFLKKIFNDVEISHLEDKNYKPETIASMFSFKEAVSKALGTGFGKDLKFKDIIITYDEKGKPSARAKNFEFELTASHDAGIAVTFASLVSPLIETLPDDVIRLYKPRPDNSYKGTFGRTMVIAGSKGMLGAGYLSSLASLKAGCGLTYHYIFEEDDIFLPLSIKHTEVILREGNFLKDIDRMDAVLFGPGLSKSRNKRALLQELLSRELNLIIDADGINMLAEDLTGLFVKKANVVLTPHVLEYARLVGEVIPPGDKLYSSAEDFAKLYGVTLVLKDSKTFITNGDKRVLLDRENSGLATAGSGDVLAGLISSLVSQGYDIFDACVLGANIHSLAGQVASSKKSKVSMLASDIINGFDEVFKRLEVR